MKNTKQAESLRSKLIIAGINEIDQHGIVDFSLRRVAQSCGASCAAPYKHFESKNELILEIIRYINHKWQLLEDQITKIYKDDVKKLIIELCLANIRFKLANPDFRAVLMINETALESTHKNEISKMSDTLSLCIKKYFEELHKDKTEIDRKLYIIRSLIYGAVIQTESLELSNDDNAMNMVKTSIQEILEK